MLVVKVEDTSFHKRKRNCRNVTEQEGIIEKMGSGKVGDGIRKQR